MPTQGPMTRAVAAAIRAAATTTDKQDEGAKALARRYAVLIDEATAAAKYGEPLRVLARVVAAAEDPEAAAKAYQKIADALAEHSVASDLGPKLLQALTALGLTPAARGTKQGGDPRAGIAQRLDEFTRRRLGQHPS